MYHRLRLWSLVLIGAVFSLGAGESRKAGLVVLGIAVAGLVLFHLLDRTDALDRWTPLRVGLYGALTAVGVVMFVQEPNTKSAVTAAFGLALLASEWKGRREDRP